MGHEFVELKNSHAAIESIDVQWTPTLKISVRGMV